MGRSNTINKDYPDGSQVKVWLNSAGLSMGVHQKGDGNKANPFLSFYSQNSGGYALVIREEELKSHGIVIKYE